MVDAKGRVAVHTGRKCIPYASHIAGNQFTCETNLMSNDIIWRAMEKNYTKNSGLLFPERLVATLEAA